MALITGLALTAGCGVDGTSALLSCPAGSVASEGRCVVPDAGGVPRPLEVSPGTLRFGDVLVSQSEVRVVEVHNPNPWPVTATAGYVPADFALSQTQLVIEAGATVELRVTFTPRQAESYSDVLWLEGCNAACSAQVLVRGEGVAATARVVCEPPPELTAVVGNCTAVPVSCRNEGAAEAQLVVARLDPDLPQLSLQIPAGSSRMPPGASATLRLDFCPNEARTYRSTASVEVQPPGRAQFGVVARGIEGVGCQLEAPFELVLPTVPAAEPSFANLTVFNRGRQLCTVEVLGFTPDSAPELYSPESGLELPLRPGGRLDLTIEFAGGPAGVYAGTFVLRERSAPDTSLSVQVRARANPPAVPLVVTSTPAGPLTGLPNGAPVRWERSSDDGIFTVPLPFPFRLFGQPVTEVTVGTNGLLEFSSQNGTLANQTLTDPQIPNHLIAWWWDDIDPGATDGDGVRYELGLDPLGRGVLTVHFDRVPTYGERTGPFFTAQLRFFEAGSRVEVQYGEVSLGNPSPLQSASVGWEGPNGLTGQAVLPCTPECRSSDWPTNTLFVYRDAP